MLKVFQQSHNNPKQQSRRNRNKLIRCSVTVIDYSVSALVVSLVLLLCLYAALFYFVKIYRQNKKFKYSIQQFKENGANTHGQSTQAVVSLYCVYCWKIIQQRMLVDNFYVKLQYKHIFFICF